MKAFGLALALGLLAHLVIHRPHPQRTPQRIPDLADCVCEGFDAWGRAHPNGGRA